MSLIVFCFCSTRDTKAKGSKPPNRSHIPPGAEFHPTASPILLEVFVHYWDFVVDAVFICLLVCFETGQNSNPGTLNHSMAPFLKPCHSGPGPLAVSTRNLPGSPP